MATIRPIEERELPYVVLTGHDGNAFAIMGTVRTAMKDVGWTSEEIDEAMNEMMSGDYNHLLTTACNLCEVD